MTVDLEYFKEKFCGYRKDTFPVSFTAKNYVESCKFCAGTGRVSREELSDYHRREYSTYHEDCKTCAGEGRVILTDISVSFGDLPYNPKAKTSNFRNILYETLVEPYDKEKAKNIEFSYFTKPFYFNISDVKEQ